jgi:hypothetical protein
MSTTAVPISILDVRLPTRRKQRERRAELAREVVDAVVRTIRANLLGRDGQLKRLHQRVGRGTHLRRR